MIPIHSIVELWSLRVDPSDLANIERPAGYGPASGGGQLYIQIGKALVPPTLQFLGVPYPAAAPVAVDVYSIGGPPGVLERIEFSSKSQDRMRIANQNRHRAPRLSAWSPAVGFPHLAAPHVTTPDAAAVIAQLGGLHIFIARDASQDMYAGYTTGAQPPANWPKNLAFYPILFGNHPGGYWAAPSKGAAGSGGSTGQLPAQGSSAHNGGQP